MGRPTVLTGGGSRGVVDSCVADEVGNERLRSAAEGRSLRTGLGERGLCSRDEGAGKRTGGFIVLAGVREGWVLAVLDGVVPNPGSVDSVSLESGGTANFGFGDVKPQRCRFGLGSVAFFGFDRLRRRERRRTCFSEIDGWASCW